MIRRLGLNSLWLLLARVAVLSLAVLFHALLARRLGVEVFGQYALVATLAFLGNVFTTFGTDTLLIRETARAGRITHLTTAAIWLQLGLSVLWIGGIMAATFAWPLPGPARPALSLLLLSLLPLAFFTVLSALARAFERMSLILALNVIAALLQIAGAALLVKNEGDLLALCAWLLACQMIVAGLAAILCRIYIPDLTFHFAVAFSDVAHLLQKAWPLALLTFFGLLSQRLSLFILQPLAGDAAVGYFSAAARLFEGLKLGHYALLGALLPVVARRGALETTRAFQIILAAMSILSLGMAAATTLFSAPIISAVYGSRFDASATALAVLVWALLPYTINACVSLMLVASGGELAILKGTAFTLLATAILQGALIQKFGLAGAAWGALAAECFQALVFIWLYQTTRLPTSFTSHDIRPA